MFGRIGGRVDLPEFKSRDSGAYWALTSLAFDGKYSSYSSWRIIVADHTAMLALYGNSRNRWGGLDRWQRLAIVLWSAILLASCGRALLLYGKDRHTGIYEVYGSAGRHWIAGENLYPSGFVWQSFPYGPIAAAFLAPFGAMPDFLGSACYRFFSIVFFLGALSWWSRTALPVRLNDTQRALLFLLVIPLTAPTMINGQMGAIIISLLLMTMAAAAEERWNLASLCAVLSCLIKVYPIAVILLLGIVYPLRCATRMFVAMVFAASLPFLLQNPEYVAGQYADWVHLLRSWMALLRSDDRLNLPVLMCNFNLLMLFRVWLKPLDVQVYQMIQLLAAASIAALCLVARRADWPSRRLLSMIFGLSGCWMTLFGSMVESFTYILVAPSLSLLLIEVWHEKRSVLLRGAVGLSWGIFLVATLAIWTPYSGAFHGMGPHAFACLVFLGCLVATAMQRLMQHKPMTVGSHVVTSTTRAA